MMRVLQEIARRLGRWGIAGAALLAASMVFYLSALRPAAKNLAARAAAAHTVPGARLPRSPAAVTADNLERFYAQFPPTRRLDKEVEKLWVLAAEFKIDLQSGEYRLETGNGGLLRYRITLPVKASYTQLRLFVNMVLKTIPTMAIESLRFERKKISEPQLDAQIKLTLYFSPETLQPITRTTTEAATP